MRGQTMSNGNSFANGSSYANGNGGLLTLVKNHQGDGFLMRPTTIYDFTEPSIIF